jgi:hypothetical protein
MRFPKWFAVALLTSIFVILSCGESEKKEQEFSVADYLPERIEGKEMERTSQVRIFSAILPTNS